MNKKFWKYLSLAMVLMMTFAVALPALAHHNNIVQEASCDGYLVKADYIGGSGLRKVEWDVDLTVDGSTENISGEWIGHHSGFNIFSRSGTGAHDVQVSGYVKMSKWKWIIPHIWGDWAEVDHDVFDLSFDADQCHQAVCPEGDGWKKIEPIDAQTYNYEAPAGEQILRTCYKAGTTVVYDPTSGQFPTPPLTYLFQSNVSNPSGTGFLDISHISVLLGERPHDYDAELDWKIDCDGIVVEAVITDKGQEIDRKVLDDHAWTDPYVLEEFGPKDYEVTLPDDSKVNLHLDMQVEPSDCQVAHEAETYLENNCDVWEVGYFLDGQKNVVDQGTWGEPENGSEQDTFPAFDITVPQGEIVNISDPDGLMSGGTVDEPKDCYVYCSVTSEPEYGEWSEWTMDPETGKEYRTRTVTIYDSEHSDYVCSEEVEKEWRWPRSAFNLTSMCRPDAESGKLRIRNGSGEPQSYTLYKYGGGYST